MKVVITGGAGFIGANAARRYVGRGEEVVILDNFQRSGTQANLKWLSEKGPVKALKVDVRDAAAVDSVMRENRDAAIVLHFAGQVAVTTSVADPRSDFEINALGTLNVLEAMRRNDLQATLIYSSTNKVYGELGETRVVETPTRYQNLDLPLGVPETTGIDFHSPYGCSKGAADQYVRDYHRIYGLNTVVFRQSCIYGARQFGVVDQGWIAWFLIATELGLPITIYGDGKQVRDVLFIDDLLDAFDAAAQSIEVARGRVYNLGGGPSNAISLLDLIAHLGVLRGEPLSYNMAGFRPGDQRIYVSDVRRAETELGWKPRVAWQIGVEKVRSWVIANRAECAAVCGAPATTGPIAISKAG